MRIIYAAELMMIYFAAAAAAIDFHVLHFRAKDDYAPRRAHAALCATRHHADADDSLLPSRRALMLRF